MRYSVTEDGRPETGASNAREPTHPAVSPENMVVIEATTTRHGYLVREVAGMCVRADRDPIFQKRLERHHLLFHIAEDVAEGLDPESIAERWDIPLGTALNMIRAANLVRDVPLSEEDVARL